MSLLWILLVEQTRVFPLVVLVTVRDTYLHVICFLFNLYVNSNGFQKKSRFDIVFHKYHKLRNVLPSCGWLVLHDLQTVVYTNCNELMTQHELFSCVTISHLANEMIFHKSCIAMSYFDEHFLHALTKCLTK